MDLEWAKDGLTGELFILQARPETVHSAKPRTAAAEIYRLKGEAGEPLVTGQAVGEKIGAGRVRVVRDIEALATVMAGDVLVAEMTDPDWEPVATPAALSPSPRSPMRASDWPASNSLSTITSAYIRFV